MKKDFIENALDVMKIHIPNEEKDLIKFVNMREYKIADKDKPLLFTVGLQTCVSIIAWCKEFSFLAHLNTVTCEPDFYTNESGEPIKCRRIEDLYNEIQKNKEEIKSNINIGLILGISKKTEKNSIESLKVIEDDFKEFFNKLEKDNIKSNRLPNMNIFSFVLDSRNGTIITDGIIEESKIIQLEKQFIKQKENEEER